MPPKNPLLVKQTISKSGKCLFIDDVFIVITASARGLAIPRRRVVNISFNPYATMRMKKLKADNLPHKNIKLRDFFIGRKVTVEYTQRVYEG